MPFGGLKETASGHLAAVSESILCPLQQLSQKMAEIIYRALSNSA